MKILKTLLLILIFSPLGLFAGQTDSTFLSKNSVVRVFPQKEFRAIYKTTIDFKDKSFSGLLLVRENIDSSFRIAFVTEVGMKIFEFEFFPRQKNAFHVVSILSYLDKAIIIKTLKRDFESIFMVFTAFKTPNIKPLEKDLYIYKYCYEGKRSYLVQGKKIQNMSRFKFFFPKEEIHFTYTNRIIPQLIKFHHFGVKLDIEMKLIKVTYSD